MHSPGLFHVLLFLDAIFLVSQGSTSILTDDDSRQALYCINALVKFVDSDKIAQVDGQALGDMIVMFSQSRTRIHGADDVLKDAVEHVQSLTCPNEKEVILAHIFDDKSTEILAILDCPALRALAKCYVTLLDQLPSASPAENSSHVPFLLAVHTHSRGVHQFLRSRREEYMVECDAAEADAIMSDVDFLLSLSLNGYELEREVVNVGGDQRQVRMRKLRQQDAEIAQAHMHNRCVRDKLVSVFGTLETEQNCTAQADGHRKGDTESRASECCCVSPNGSSREAHEAQETDKRRRTRR
jgi:hypothetical protein